MADRPVFLYAAIYDEIADAEATTRRCSISTPRERSERSTLR
jgi:hypothetical protein